MQSSVTTVSIEAPLARSAVVTHPPGRRLAWVLLAVFAIAFLTQAAPRISAPFGDSHDGRNGAVWGLLGRALREDGVVGSRFAHSAVLPGPYAHHPPLIVAETAIAETVPGERGAATRAPAWLGALATIPLLYLLLRCRGFAPVASAAAVVLVLSGPMFLLYGTMLDTLQVSFPPRAGPARRP